MKLSNFFPLILLALTGCQQHNKTSVMLPPNPVSKSEKATRVYEGASGLVHIKLLEHQDTQIDLPQQITVTIEKPDSRNSNFSIADYPLTLAKFLFGTNNDTVTFGCNPEDATTLPNYLNAQTVILCGKIKIPSGKFEMHTTTLVLHDADISTESSQTNISEVKSLPSVMIYTGNLVTSGFNSLILEGFSNGIERESAPALFLNIGSIEGTGNLHITSRKLLKLM